MEHTPLPFIWRKRRTILTWAATLILLCVALLGAARLWIKTDSGRAFALSQINGRNISGYGVIEITGLSGDPLSRMLVDRVTITDEDGVWIEAERIDITWTPWALTGNKVHLNDVLAERVTLIRRPIKTKTEGTSSSSKRRRTAMLDSLQITHLRLLEGAAGSQADFKAQAKLVTTTDNEFDIGLMLSPQSTTTDNLSFKLSRDVVGDIRLNANGYAEPNGAFANLLHLLPGQSAQLDADITGTRIAGDGFARILIDEYKAADLTTNWAGNDLTTSILLDAAKMPVSERAANLIGGAARINVSAKLDDTSAPFHVTGSLEGAIFSARGHVDLNTRELTEPLEIEAKLANMEPFIGRAIAADLNGTLSGNQNSVFDGTLIATPLAESELPFTSVSGPIRFDAAKQSIPFTVDLTAADFRTSSPQLMKLLSASPNLVASGSFDRGTGELSLEQTMLNGADGHITASGQLSTREESVALAGEITVPIHALVDKAHGIVSGNYALSGPVDELDLDFRVTGREIAGLQEHIQNLIGNAATLEGKARLKRRELTIETARFSTDVLSASASGTYQPNGAATLNINAQQHTPLQLGDAAIMFGSVTALVSGQAGNRAISVSTEVGRLELAGQSVDQMALTTQLTQSELGLSGDVQMSGNAKGQTAQLSSSITYQAKALALPDIRGTVLGADLSSQMTRSADGEIEGDLVVAGNQLRFEGATLGSLDLATQFAKVAGEPLTLSTKGAVQGISLANGLEVDALSGSAEMTDNAATFDLTAIRDAGTASIDVKATGGMTWADSPLSGSVTLSGDAFGHSVVTHTPIGWSQTKGGSLGGDLSIMGGRLTANRSSARAGDGLYFDAANLDLSPLAQYFGIPLSRAELNGAGRLNLFGPAPSGEFAFTADGAIDGIDTPLEADITGKLSARALTVKSRATAEELRLTLDAVLPIKTGTTKQIAKLSPDGAIRSRATLNGDLSALSPIALAFGHDVGGMIKAQATMAGNLNAPSLNAAGSLSGGQYENGRTGMRLRNIEGVAAFDEGRLSVTANGRDRNGGSFTVSGTSNAGAVQIESELKGLKLYDRDDDDLTVSGRLEFTQTKTVRDLSGQITLEEGHFDVTHLPASDTKAIKVRWENELGGKTTRKSPARPVQLNIKIDAPRRLFVDGRGLTSEWGLDLAISGDTSTPILTGAASLERGDLDFAGRPFVFDTGEIEFNGPISASTVALSAERTVNGFTARIGLSGSPQSPTLDLTSSPSLPEDEILSRLLFGRASVDLSALEAAQVAASVSRILGHDSGIDPSETLKNALGVDRFSLGSSDSGQTKVGIGQFITDNVYAEVASTIAEGTSIEVEWEPRPNMSISSETTTTGENKLSIKWKNDF